MNTNYFSAVKLLDALLSHSGSCSIFLQTASRAADAVFCPYLNVFLLFVMKINNRGQGAENEDAVIDPYSLQQNRNLLLFLTFKSRKQ